MKFEEVKQPIHDIPTQLPIRATYGSAGYDIWLKEDIQLNVGERVD